MTASQCTQGRPTWVSRPGTHKAVLLVVSLGLNFFLLTSRTEEDHAGEAHDPSTAGILPSAAGRSLGTWDPQLSSESVIPGRQLAAEVTTSSGSASASASGSGSGSGSSGGHHAHQHDAMLFLFDAFVVGAFVLHMMTFVPQLQETVVLFVIGMIYSLLTEGIPEIKTETRKFGQSYDMWMNIDPHLILFTMLPALLAGDAMTIDTSVAKRVAGQCLYFAGPGVLINAGIVALFLKYFLDWKFYLAMTTAAILCATDPVAVVALLKELGASPVLTVQIQGESLLNDGTAIVVYMVSYDFLKGHQYDGIDITMILVQKAFLAWGTGMFIGYFFFTWIRLASNKLDHHSGMIQITLTLCCAYWSFIFAEGVMGWSGVLSTVAASLVLAHHMWPHIVAPDTIHHVWHTFEALGNIIIFFLAGALTGNVMVHIDGINYLYLMVIYIVLVIVRGGIIFASRPFLKYLSTDRQPVTMANAAVMTWGGLRGAVGLALAIQVSKDRAPSVEDEDFGMAKITETQGQQVLFFVAGIAFLTMIINATTCPYLVNWLEITALPHSQQKLLKMLSGQLINWSEHQDHPKPVVDSLRHMIKEVQEEIGKQKVRRVAVDNTEPHEPSDKVIENYKAAKEEYDKLPKSALKLLGDKPQETMAHQADNLIELIKGKVVDCSMARAVNRSFLQIVSKKYWHMLEEGNMRPGTPEADVLLTSIQVTPLHADLIDFDFVCDRVKNHMEFEDDEDDMFMDMFKTMTEKGDEVPSLQDKMKKLVKSARFNIFIAVMILLNAAFVVVDYMARTPENEFNEGWIAVEGIFTILFTLEAVLKIYAKRMDYFTDGWNLFDFFLVWLGIAGFAISCSVQQNRSSNRNLEKLLKISRVFRLLRFLRVIRLFHQKFGAEKVPTDVSTRMHRCLTLTCFISAHQASQIEIVKYFGGNNKVDDEDEKEIARCLIQSMTSVHKAQTMVAAEEENMGDELKIELNYLRLRKRITETLEKFVMEAFEEGAISATEAEQMLHPMHHHLEHCMKDMEKVTDGEAKGLVAKGLHQITHAASDLTHATSGAIHGVSDNLHLSGGHGQGPSQKEHHSSSQVEAITPEINEANDSSLRAVATTTD